MFRRSKAVIAGIFACLLVAGSVLAEDIPITNPAWLSLTEAQKDQIKNDLKAQGVLGKDDDVKYAGPTSTRPVETNIGLPVVTKITKEITRVKSALDRERAQKESAKSKK